MFGGRSLNPLSHLTDPGLGFSVPLCYCQSSTCPASGPTWGHSFSRLVGMTSPPSGRPVLAPPSSVSELFGTFRSGGDLVFCQSLSRRLEHGGPLLSGHQVTAAVLGTATLLGPWGGPWMPGVSGANSPVQIPVVFSWV